MTSRMHGVSAIEVENQNWLLFVKENGQLAYLHSQNPDENLKKDYQGPEDIMMGRDRVIPDQGTPISATSYSSDNGTEIRLYYFNDQYLRELCWDSTQKDWYEGDLSYKDIEVSPDSGLSAKQLSGYLKVYFENEQKKLTVCHTLLNEGSWDTTSIQK